MGSCGCGDYAGEFKFAGPDKTIYVVERYAGCHDCDTPAGVVIYKMLRETGDDWDAVSLPDLPFGHYAGGEVGDGEVMIPVVHHDQVAKKIGPWLDANWAEYIDAEEVDADQLYFLLEDGIREQWGDVISASMSKHGEFAERKRSDHDARLELLKKIRFWLSDQDLEPPWAQELNDIFNVPR